jgi:hypothetical protein
MGLMLTAALMLVMSGAALAETVHQTVNCDKIRTGDGGNAIEKGKMEAQKVEGADSGQVARMKGSVGQWDYVTCWFGLPAPVGKSIVRFHIYVDGQKTAKCLLYIRSESGQTMVGELKIPADAKEKSFVTVDVPVDAKAEWNGLTIKKAEKSDLPSPWIDTVSVVLPD